VWALICIELWSHYSCIVFFFLFTSLYLLLVCFIITWVLKCHPCLVGTVVEVLPKDKKKKEEEKSAILGQCSVDLLPMLTGFGYFLVMLLVVFTARRSYASTVLGVVILSVCPSICVSVCHMCALWLIQRTYWRYFYTAWKGNPSSFLVPKISAKFQRGHPRWGAKWRSGRLKRRFSTNIWLYLTNGAK